MKMKLMLFIRILTLLYIVVVTVLSLVNISGDTVPFHIPHIDKVVHFCFYFGFNLMLLTSLSCFHTFLKRKVMLLITGFTITYSASIELVQSQIGRSCELADLAANTLGATVAVLLFALAQSRMRYKLPSRK